MRPCYIYGLCDPDTEEVRYIGKSVDPVNRYWAHLRRARAGTAPKVYAWIRSLQQRGKAPGLQVILACDERSWRDAERAFISVGPDLLNMTPGGDGVPSELIAAAHAGTYLVTFPDGTEREVTNLSAFCRQRGIPNANAFKVIAGKRHHAHGYRFRRVGEPPRERQPRYFAEHPDGTKEPVYSLKEWAESHGLNPHYARRVACGQKPHYQGIKIRRAEEMVDP